jgi:hypothetical protein
MVEENPRRDDRMIEIERPHATFYKISMDESNPKALMDVEVDSKGFDSSRFNRGEWINNWPEDITFSYAIGEYAEDHLLGGPYWELVSERVRQVFERHKIYGVQFLPVKAVFKKTGKEVGKYWAMNVFQEVDALDWVHTIWSTTDLNEIKEYPTMSIISEALLFNPLEEKDIFRLKIKGRKRISIFISNRLRELLEEAQATSGFLFFPIQAY